MHAVLVYGFPLFLLLFEWGLRTIMIVDSWGFTGPTLAAAGLSFLMPLTKPKVLQVAIQGQPNAIVTSKSDREFVAITWLFVLLYLFIWSFTCYTSIKAPEATELGMSRHLVVGGGAYLFSLFMVAVKEKV